VVGMAVHGFTQVNILIVSSTLCKFQAVDNLHFFYCSGML